MPVQPDGRPPDILAVALPRAAREVKCDGCGRLVHPLLFRYLFLNVGWRGKPVVRPHRTEHVTLCGQCADMALERLWPVISRRWAMRVGVKL